MEANKASEPTAEAKAQKPISLESNVGKCGIRISGTFIAESLANLLPKFLGYVCWHDGASAVFGGGKKAIYKRNSEYSEAFGLHTKTALAKILSPFFSNLKIETFKLVVKTEEERFVENAVKIGLTAEQAKTAYAQAQANKAASAAAETAQPKAEQEPKTVE